MKVDMKRNFIFHPILFAAFPILFFYAHNKTELPFEVVFLPILVSVSLALLLWLFSLLVLRSKSKAALFTSISILLFYSYGHLYSLIKGFGIHLGSYVLGENKILYISYALVLFALGCVLLKTRRSLGRLTGFLNLVALVLVLISITDIVPYEIVGRKEVSIQQGGGEEIKSGGVLSEEGVLPDIYYIILDSYPRNDILKDIFSYDNSEFTDFLKEKGFYIASESRSNYAHTFFSLPATLHLEYVNYLADKLGEKSKDNTLPLSMIETNKVVSFLKSQGYKFINVGSGWFQTDYNKHADLNLTGGGPFAEFNIGGRSLNELAAVFLQTTMLRPFVEDLLSDDVRAMVLHAFDAMEDIPEMPDPTFTMAHFTPPHPPFLFDADGNPVPEAKLELIGDVYADRENYLNQLIFINKKVKVMIDEILKKSETPPIIILCADHGSTTTLGHPYHWPRPPEENLPGIKERMSILNSYYLPYGGDRLLYDSISPVNTFRLIFNYYFGTDYELLPDKSYYSDYKYYYEFFDVTDEIEPD